MTDENQDMSQDASSVDGADAGFDAALDALAPPATPADILRRGDIHLSGEASEDLREMIRDQLGLLSLDRLTYRATLSAVKGEITLQGTVSAALAQACVVTLEPAPQAIEESVHRQWLPPARYAERMAALTLGPDSELARAGADQGVDAGDRGAIGFDLSVEGADEFEPMTDPIRIGPALVETVALALDPYPRAPDAAFDGAIAGPEGATPFDDDAVKPFAGLKALRDKMTGENGDG